jgi:hypothetical protein
MKYVGDLITEIRRDTRNEDVPTGSEQVGISTEDFLRYLNFAQEKCQAIAISAKSTKFQAVKEIALQPGVAQYPIRDRVYLEEHILDVMYSDTGQARNYYKIPERALSQRIDYPGTPNFYIRRGGSVILCPLYNSLGAKIRVTYDRAVDSLDIRRGTVIDATIISNALINLQLDIDTDDADALSRAQFVCINDAFGNVTMYNIPVIGYNASTGILAIKDTSFAFQAGETASVGSFVTVGQYSTTHSKLNHLCERYMAQYAEYKIFRRDSSNDANAARDDMRETLREISISYSETPRDEGEIQINNPDLMVGVW